MRGGWTPRTRTGTGVDSPRAIGQIRQDGRCPAMRVVYCMNVLMSTALPATSGSRRTTPACLSVERTAAHTPNIGAAENPTLFRCLLSHVWWGRTAQASGAGDTVASVCSIPSNGSLASGLRVHVICAPPARLFVLLMRIWPVVLKHCRHALRRVTLPHQLGLRGCTLAFCLTASKAKWPNADSSHATRITARWKSVESPILNRWN